MDGDYSVCYNSQMSTERTPGGGSHRGIKDKIEDAQELWVDLTCSTEYSRFVKYILLTPRTEWNKLIAVSKIRAIDARRIAGAVSGLTVGLVGSGVVPEATDTFGPYILAGSVGILGLNYLLDELIDQELKKSS